MTAALSTVLEQAAQQAIADGITPADAQVSTGALAAWVRRNISYREGTEFFIVFLLACELADIFARREGYDNNLDKCCKLAFANMGETK